MEEKLRLARLSQRLRFQDEGRGRLSHLYKKILTALHRQRKVGICLGLPLQVRWRFDRLCANADDSGQDLLVVEVAVFLAK